MNRKLVYKNIMINLGEVKSEDIDNTVIRCFNQSNIRIDVINKRYNEYNCYIECNIEVTYKMVVHLLKDITFSDMYYLFSEKQTVTKDEILHRLIERDIIKDILLN